MTFHNPRSTFVEVLTEKLESKTETKIILETKCANEHGFRIHIEKIAQTLFNLFAKNLIAEENSKIHKSRKRRTADPKKSATERKLKKISSS